MTIQNRFSALYRRVVSYVRSRQILRGLRSRSWQESPAYEDYLGKQLVRSLRKRDHVGTHTQILADRIAASTDLSQCDVLCVGCRNMTEIDYFRSRKARRVVGIDLFSQSPEILVMDMHQMTFPSDQFDIVFSSHSLEHSFDANQVIAELARVCRPNGLIAVEVPVQFTPTGADRVDFGDLEHLHQAFSPYVSSVIWSDSQPPRSTSNAHNIAIVRTIMVATGPRVASSQLS